MSIIISLFHVLAALTLILVVLLQAGKDSGLAGAFGGGGGAGASDSVFGAQSNSFLNKFTTVMAIIFMITSLVLALISSQKNRSVVMEQEDPVAAVVAEEIPAATDAVTEAVSDVAESVETAKAVVAEEVAAVKADVVQAAEAVQAEIVEDVARVAETVVAKTEPVLATLETAAAEAVADVHEAVADTETVLDKDADAIQAEVEKIIAAAKQEALKDSSSEVIADTAV